MRNRRIPKSSPQATLANIPIYGDVRELTGKQLRADGIIPDVIVGGYPCQPFSLAGDRRGEEDDRHLWPEVRRLVKEIRPAWCIFENVAGHITMGIDEVLSDLEAENYSARPFVIPACGVDAPHRRDRVWIVAHTQINRNRRTSRQGEEANGEVSKRDDSGVANQSSEVCSTLAYSNRNDGRRERSTEPQGRYTRLEHGGSSERQPIGQSDEDVAYTFNERPQGRVQGEKETKWKSELGYAGRSGAAHGQSGENQWTVEPSVGRVANGLPNRTHRIKALGNAVVPQPE